VLLELLEIEDDVLEDDEVVDDERVVEEDEVSEVELLLTIFELSTAELWCVVNKVVLWPDDVTRVEFADVGAPEAEATEIVIVALELPDKGVAGGEARTCWLFVAPAVACERAVDAVPV
jgi:hypothetical protein